jgi:2-phospho-L-lactate/phosphoenolpyruvate guanylyltransferase
MNVVAVPVKDLVNAKQRLVRALSPSERMALARAMLHDVLRALVAAPLDARWLITRDPEVTATARDYGVEVISEAVNQGHTAAVAAAQTLAVRAGARVFATIPGDVPCVTAEEIGALVTRAGAEGRAAAFAPSHSGLGTNGAALCPPGAMPLTFGEPSFDDHLRVARERELVAHVLALPGLGLDVDGPADLPLLLVRGPHTESGRLLARWSIAERVAG